MRNLTYFLLLLLLVACSANSGRTENVDSASEKSSTAGGAIDTFSKRMIGEDWGNISVDTAKLLIRTFCLYSDSMKEKNVTKAVWFRRSEIHESFNKIFMSAEFGLKSDMDYDGYRIYFARYPGDWRETEKRYQNTIVITKTRSLMVKGEYGHEDILEINKASGVFIQPLNDGGRCRPSCNGVLLLDEIYTQERTN
jgi:hypothetical protein